MVNVRLTMEMTMPMKETNESTISTIGFTGWQSSCLKHTSCMYRMHVINVHRFNPYDEVYI